MAGVGLGGLIGSDAVVFCGVGCAHAGLLVPCFRAALYQKGCAINGVLVTSVGTKLLSSGCVWQHMQPESF